ncbi:MAG: hypothetical protein OXU62_04585 [Gammaproteobacteria bacterium]|nr:hypothetical protein [Gammaproteobacteria bacterium]
MKTQTVIIALAAALFAFPVGAQDDWETRKAKEIAERAYLYAALCEGSKSSYRTKACELLFTVILTDLGGRSFNQIMSRKSIDKIHDIID